jgi:hypothetical protein
LSFLSFGRIGSAIFAAGIDFWSRKNPRFAWCEKAVEIKLVARTSPNRNVTYDRQTDSVALFDK